MNTQLETLEAQSKQKMKDLLSEIDSIEKAALIKDLEAKTEKMEADEAGEAKKIAEGAKTLLDLKLEMLLSEEAKRIKAKLKNFILTENKRQELEEQVEDIEDSKDIRETAEKYLQYETAIKENNLDLKKETSDFLKIKIKILSRTEKESFKGALKENILPDNGKEILDQLRELEAVETSEKLIYDAERLKENVDRFLEQGFISKNSQKELADRIQNLKDIFSFKIALGQNLRRQEADKSSDQAALWKEMIENLSLKRERKELLKRLADELLKTETIFQVEDFKVMGQREIQALSQESVKKEQIKKIEEIFNSMVTNHLVFIKEKALSALRKKIEELNKFNAQQASMINEYLRRIIENASQEEIKKNLDSLQEYVQRKPPADKERDKKVKEDGSWQIYILPPYLIAPVGSSRALKTIVIYNKLFIKEDVPGLEWHSSGPDIATVDDAGVVRMLSKGGALIKARYKGGESQEVEVIGVDRMDEQTNDIVKKEINLAH